VTGAASRTIAARNGPDERHGLRTAAPVVVSMLAHMLTFTGLALFLPLIREDMQLSFTQGGVLSAAATFSYALGQMPAGYFADRFGAKRLFFVGLLGWAVMSFAFGLIHSFWLAVANQLVAGAFRALLFAPGLSLLAASYGPERRATAMSFFWVGCFCGNIVLALLGPLLATQLGWRGAYMFFAALGVVAVFGYFLSPPQAAPPGAAQRFAVAEALQLLRHGILWVCAAIQFVRFAVATAFNFWLPSLLVSDRGFSLQAAGLAIAMGSALTALGNPLGGYVSDRMRNPSLVIGGSLAVLACTSALLVLVDSIAMVWVVIAVNSLFVGFYFGPLFQVPLEALGARSAGTAIGFGNFFANVGGLLAAYALGVIKDHAGSFQWGFLGISVLCVAGVALSVVLARVRAAAAAPAAQG
jgi:sugar phosphate permease